MKLTTIKIRPQKLERWKMIEGYSNYMVSSLGRVKSLNYRNTGKAKIIKLRKSKYGYLQIGLYKDGKIKAFLVHRLVALAFIPNPENKETVNHIDENKANNNVKNLEWMTSKENCNHGTRNKRVSETHKGEKGYWYGKHHSEETKKKMSDNHANFKGEKHPRARKVRCLETGEVFDCIKFAVEWCGLKSKASITLCCQGKKNSAGKHPVTGVGLHWEYVIEEINLDLNIFTSNIKLYY